MFFRYGRNANTDFIWVGKFWFAFYKRRGSIKKYAAPAVYPILFERIWFPSGSGGKLAGQFKAEVLNGFLNFGFGHGAAVLLVGANVFGGDGAVKGGGIKRIVVF